jgi:formate dehydrogenase
MVEKLGHELLVTIDKDGPNSEFEKVLRDAEVIISHAAHDAGIVR